MEEKKYNQFEIKQEVRTNEAIQMQQGNQLNNAQVSQIPAEKMGRFKASKLLVKESWKLLMQDKEMMFFPIISAIANVLFFVLICAFFYFLVLNGSIETFGRSKGFSTGVEIVYVFVTYFVSIFIAVFFQAGIIAIAHGRLNGNNLSFADGLNVAFGKIGKIVAWSLIAATVGTILKLVSEKSDNVITKIITALLGAAWSIITFFIVPVIIMEDISTKESMKKSVDTIRKTWGETAIVNIGVGFYFMFLAILGVLTFIGALLTGKMAVILSSLVLLIIYLILLSVISSTLSTIFKVVLYEYASTGMVLGGFSSEIMSMAFEKK